MAALRKTDMDKIVVYTAVMGGFDYLEAPLVRGNARFIAFADEKIESPGWELRVIKPTGDPRRAARMFKLLPHKYLPEATVSIWIDGNIGILVDPQRIVDEWLSEHDWATFKHLARDCIYQEAEICAKWGKAKRDVVEAQMERYRNEGYPVRFGLTESSVVARRHTEEVARFNEAWWNEILNGSARDQLSFNYLCRKMQMSYKPMEEARTHRWFNFRMWHGEKKKGPQTLEDAMDLTIARRGWW